MDAKEARMKRKERMAKRAEQGGYHRHQPDRPADRGPHRDRDPDLCSRPHAAGREPMPL
ncbi:MAG: hypothetical protein ACLR0P_06625 [Oscillospiraceae bacterium]